MTDELLLLELVERKAIAGLRVVVVLLDIGDNTRSHHQLYVAGRSDLIIVLVFRLKVLSDDIPMGDDVGAKIVVDQSDEGGREQIGPHQPLEAHTGSQHRDDFGVAR